MAKYVLLQNSRHLDLAIGIKDMLGTELELVSIWLEQKISGH